MPRFRWTIEFEATSEGEARRAVEEAILGFSEIEEDHLEKVDDEDA